MNLEKSIAIALSIVAGVGAVEKQAFAQGGIPRCVDLPNTIYATGTTAVVPVIRRIGAKLSALPTKHTLIYRSRAACEAISYMSGKSTFVANETAEYYLEQGDGKAVTQKCNLPTNQEFDLAVSDVFSTSCPQSYLEGKNMMPEGLKEFVGPVQGVVPIVVISNYNNDIMFEEMETVYVCGDKGGVSTFNSTNYIFNYPNGEGMRELLAKLGKAHGDSWLIDGSGCDVGRKADASAMLTCVANTINPEATIAYTSTEVYDENRDKVKALKLRGPLQKKAYLPDTDLTSRDKVNIREGRYMLQSALKLIAKVDANGVPSSAGAKKLLDWMQGNPIDDPNLQLPVSIISIYAKSGVVPQCAMKVTKKTDDPIFKHYQPEKPCHCYFLKEATAAASIEGCVSCADSSTCASGKVCSYGYCE